MGKGRTPCCEKGRVKKGPWSQAEDLKLISFIHKHGHNNWRSLPKLAGLARCGKSCRLRWVNYLRPDLKRGNFTPDEEDTIIRLQQLLGNKWSKIASHLPGRTDNEIKNVWNTHLKKRLSPSTTSASNNTHANNNLNNTQQQQGKSTHGEDDDDDVDDDDNIGEVDHYEQSDGTTTTHLLSPRRRRRQAGSTDHEMTTLAAEIDSYNYLVHGPAAPAWAAGDQMSLIMPTSSSSSSSCLNAAAGYGSINIDQIPSSSGCTCCFDIHHDSNNNNNNNNVNCGAIDVIASMSMMMMATNQAMMNDKHQTHDGLQGGVGDVVIDDDVPYFEEPNLVELWDSLSLDYRNDGDDVEEINKGTMTDVVGHAHHHIQGSSITGGGGDHTLQQTSDFSTELLKPAFTGCSNELGAMREDIVMENHFDSMTWPTSPNYYSYLGF